MPTASFRCIQQTQSGYSPPDWSFFTPSDLANIDVNTIPVFRFPVFLPPEAVVTAATMTVWYSAKARDQGSNQNTHFYYSRVTEQGWSPGPLVAGPGNTLPQDWMHFDRVLSYTANGDAVQSATVDALPMLTNQRWGNWLPGAYIQVALQASGGVVDPNVLTVQMNTSSGSPMSGVPRLDVTYYLPSGPRRLWDYSLLTNGQLDVSLETVGAVGMSGMSLDSGGLKVTRLGPDAGEGGFGISGWGARDGETPYMFAGRILVPSTVTSEVRASVNGAAWGPVVTARDVWVPFHSDVYVPSPGSSQMFTGMVVTQWSAAANQHLWVDDLVLMHSPVPRRTWLKDAGVLFNEAVNHGSAVKPVPIPRTRTKQGADLPVSARYVKHSAGYWERAL